MSLLTEENTNTSNTEETVVTTAVDKNQAVIDYLITCPKIKGTPLYFNFIKIKDGNSQIITATNDRYASRRYVDGSIMRRYTFTFVVFKSVSDNAIVQVTENNVTTQPVAYPNENVTDLSDVQAIIDWINDQSELRNYPNFGENCKIDDMITTSDNPKFEGVNHTLNPPLAMYSVTIEISYLDISKQLWR